MKMEEVQAILDYIYCGEVYFPSQTSYDKFMKNAKLFGLKGLSETSAPISAPAPDASGTGASG